MLAGMIRALVHSDDGAVRAEFDATYYFCLADDEEIIGLADANWGCDEYADRVSRFFEESNPDVSAVITYVVAHTEDAMGYQCHVNVADALPWVRAERAHLLEAAEGNDQGAG